MMRTRLLVRALAVLAIVGLVVALVLTGTIDLQSAFGVSQEEFTEAREMLLAEDFGVGIYLGGSFDRTIKFLGTSASFGMRGRSRTAEYFVPLGQKTTSINAEGTLKIIAVNDVITAVTLTLDGQQAKTAEGEDVKFGGTKLDELEPGDLVGLFGKPAARFVVLDNKVFAWFLLPPLKTDQGVQFDLSRTMEITANFNKGDGRLRKLSVKVPRQRGR
jgi:hypothetical protein